MRGISAIVELLLITLLLITLVSLLWLFTSGTINVIARSGTNQTQRTQEIFSTCMIVDSVYENKVYLKNCGYGVITNDSLGVYLDDTRLEYNMTPQKIDKGGVGTITANLFGISLGIHNLKITNPNTQTVQEIEASLPVSNVLDLRFDEGSGTIARDYSGNGNDGTLNMPSNNWVPGIHGSALNFVEGGGGATVSSCGTMTCVFTNSNPFSLSQITASAWIKQQAYTRCELVVIRKTWGGSGGMPAGSFRFGTGGNCTQSVCDVSNTNPIILQLWDSSGSQHNFYSNKNVSLNVWHHILANYNGTHVNFYLDGNNVGNISYSGGIISGPASTFIIGAGEGACQGSFNGAIDSVRIYSNALTPYQTFILKMK